MKLSELYAQFSTTKVKKKVKYCNNNITPELKRLGIDWDMDTNRIKFCGRTFPMKYIDNGNAEEFIKNLTVNEQSTLDMWKL